MDKEKLLKGLMYLSAFSLSIILSAISLYVGFNHVDHGNPTLLIIGLLLIPAVFFFAYKGFKLILDSIFD